MRLYKIWLEAKDGEEYTFMVGARSLTIEQATKYACQQIRNDQDKYFREEDIEYIERTWIDHVKTLNGHIYIINLKEFKEI